MVQRRAQSYTLAIAIVAALASALGWAPRLGAEPVTIAAAPVWLNPDKPDDIAIGRLTYAGGLVLTASDRRFAGLSGLELVEGGQRILAVSDFGDWITARLMRDQAGRLIGLDEAAITPLRDTAGRPLRGKRRGDAEGLRIGGDGAVYVSFERDHRLMRYAAWPATPRSTPRAMALPEAIRRLPDNNGIEALAVLPEPTPPSLLRRAYSAEAAASAAKAGSSRFGCEGWTAGSC